MSQYIFITGGVISSLGKGITAASIGRLLIARGLRIRMLKMDPYLNVDPGTMSPFQHGEVYVTEDGIETDLDLGHYERFTSQPMSRKSSVSAGRIYWDVLQKERRGDYHGHTLQMIPHITDEIKTRIRALAADDVDVVITEIGGTVGDIEGLTFLEAIRQIGMEEGRENVMYVHMTYLPFIRAAGELKTKPSQQSAARLREIGIIPDALICRSETAISTDIRRKLSLFCNVPEQAVIEERDVAHTIYEVPLDLSRQGLDDIILNHFRLDRPPADMQDWEKMVESIAHPAATVRIGILGNDAGMPDAYKSLHEALRHGAAANRAAVQLVSIAPESLDAGAVLPAGLDGLLVPGSSDPCGTEGRISAIRQAREGGLPFLGMGNGMACAVMEYARHACSLADDVIRPPDGADTRLGAFPCRLKPGSRAAAAYHTTEISERHRHGCELNNRFREAFEAAGLSISGQSPDGSLIEIVEIPAHSWFVAVQFHPELKSQALAPHPLFRDFIAAAIQHQKKHA